MKEAAGTQLGEVWDDVRIPGKTNIVKGLVEIEKKPNVGVLHTVCIS
jgi:hypothetical protein